MRCALQNLYCGCSVEEPLNKPLNIMKVKQGEVSAVGGLDKDSSGGDKEDGLRNFK